jgi:hypothetical protein
MGTEQEWRCGTGRRGVTLAQWKTRGQRISLLAGFT